MKKYEYEFNFDERNFIKTVGSIFTILRQNKSQSFQLYGRDVLAELCAKLIILIVQFQRQ